MFSDLEPSGGDFWPLISDRLVSLFKQAQFLQLKSSESSEIPSGYCQHQHV